MIQSLLLIGALSIGDWAIALVIILGVVGVVLIFIRYSGIQPPAWFWPLVSLGLLVLASIAVIRLIMAM